MDGFFKSDSCFDSGIQAREVHDDGLWMGHSLFPRRVLPRPLRKPSAFIVETAHFSCFVLTFLGLFPHCRDL